MRLKVVSVLGVSALLLCGCTQAAPPPEPPEPPNQMEAPPVISSASGGAGTVSIEDITSSTSKIAVSADCVGSGKLILDFSTKVGSMEVECLEAGTAPGGRTYFDVSAVEGKFSVDVNAAEGQSWQFTIAESNKIL